MWSARKLGLSGATWGLQDLSEDPASSEKVGLYVCVYVDYLMCEGKERNYSYSSVNSPPYVDIYY